MDQVSSETPSTELADEQLGFFRWGQIGGRVVLTNDASEWTTVTSEELNEFLTGGIVEGHPRFDELKSKGFLREGLDLDEFASRISRRCRNIHRGPSLHVLTVCGIDADRRPSQMTAATAEKIVDFVLQSPAAAITIEFQAQNGEPLENFAVIQQAVERARHRNEQTTGKTLTIRLVSNLSGMSESHAEWLIANDVHVVTCFDGPPSVHDENRQRLGGTPHSTVVSWLEYFDRRNKELGRDRSAWRVEVLVAVTRRVIEASKQVIDEYVSRQLPLIHLQPLSPTAFSADTWAAIGYTHDEYLRFYRAALDSIVELNQAGHSIVERSASVILTKILTAEDPGAVDLQSPTGEGSNLLVYEWDGRVFPSEEARTLALRGDAMFDLGDVRELTVSKVLRHPTVRAIAAASLLDSQPLCATCWNKPFCGFSPVRNYVAQGDLFGQRHRCFDCKEHMAISVQLLEILCNDEDAVRSESLKHWIAASPKAAGDIRLVCPVP